MSKPSPLTDTARKRGHGPHSHEGVPADERYVLALAAAVLLAPVLLAGAVLYAIYRRLR